MDVAKEEKDRRVKDPPRPAVYRFVQKTLDSFFTEIKNKEEDNENHDMTKVFTQKCNQINSAPFMGTMEHNYKDSASRLAYLLLHFTQHTYIINSVLSDAYAACTNLQSRTTVFNELMRSVDWGRISVFSLGGGPAADVMGVLMWLHRFGFQTKVQAATAETCKKWEETTNSMYKMLRFESGDDNIKPSPQQKYTHNLWKKLDGDIKFFKSSLKSNTTLFKSGSKEMVAIGQADIVTLPFALSSVAEAPEISDLLQCIVNAIKPGALLVYVDHTEGPQTELMNNLAYWCGMRRIYFMKEMKYSMPKYEAADILADYSKDLKNPVPRDTKVTAIIYKKPSGYSYDRRMKMSKREQQNIKQAQMRLKKSNPDFKLFRPSFY